MSSDCVTLNADDIEQYVLDTINGPSQYIFPDKESKLKKPLERYSVRCESNDISVIQEIDRFVAYINQQMRPGRTFFYTWLPQLVFIGMTCRIVMRGVVQENIDA